MEPPASQSGPLRSCTGVAFVEGQLYGELRARPVSLPPRYIVGVVLASKTRLLTVPFHSSGMGGGASVALASAAPALFFLSAALGGMAPGNSEATLSPPPGGAGGPTVEEVD
eukprot:CAMPEP_0204512670 /NCGR_PEP_ID=MMETSP0661-20131031/1080_1 /ASSEMBLY_ACC=CAM_ASM_000606 /TAXON_ID=109239 /ORGANISM="Alexandrium margalefi, Strain AMGDE01CS-322" /LENGTH=111 /DNA_ID=CAMNT_0051517797 /DNA_START=110 /DNA_END=445 /DNA_ORIENTATION=-